MKSCNKNTSYRNFTKIKKQHEIVTEKSSNKKL